MKEPKTKTVLMHIFEDLQDIEQFICGISKADFKINSIVKKRSACHFSISEKCLVNYRKICFKSKRT
jgi:uncharacterized protein with HEPN domain